ncbi:BnaAnng32460D [Brassica napus]|uniref:(rape) hypothetical protein n=1 Tax=Brassica napus TaxID=3708 RepID=A0A078JD63_BRANA|nr:unnamed protein product [Brassica napus]CDY23590.1 BnaC05g40040D [Brassica napus]CDY62307.1 BnaA09g54260D [Brassica napus]CDY70059.1 BnaAnng32460D [Brassica napus]
MMNRSGSSKTCNKSRLNRKDKSHAETSTNRDGNGGRLNRKDKSTDDTPANRAGKYNYWIPRKTEILLNLVNVELKAKDYTIRLPDNPAKKRIEEKYYEMTGDKIIFEPEMRNRLDYMRRLRQHYNMLINRTGVRVNPTTEQIEMPSSWWDDRIAEAGTTNGKFIRVLQSKPLPFKELLDQIYGEHDLDQDERYSPFMLGEHIQQMQAEEASDDETTVADTAEDSGRLPSEPISLIASDDEFPTREEAHRSPSRANKSILRVQSTSTKRTNRRRVNFETQIQSGFQRMEESRTNLLDVLRSRHYQKATFGDALALLETLDVEPMGSFWWAASGFGVDRYGDSCQIINLRETSNTPTSPVPLAHSQMAGITTRASPSFSQGQGMFESGPAGTSFSSLLGVLGANSLGLSSGL